MQSTRLHELNALVERVLCILAVVVGAYRTISQTDRLDHSAVLHLVPWGLSMRRALVKSTLAFTVAIVLAGCSGSSGPQITGLVMLDGSPLADAELLFEKRDKEGVGKFGARCNAEGKFEVPNIPGRNIAPGKYVVLITKWVDKKGKITEPAEIDQLRAAGLARNIVPDKYGDAASSPLSAEIKEGKNELPKFELVKGK
jgi:hypothetical protein